MKRFLRAVTALLVVGGCTTAAVDSSSRRGQAVLRDKTGQQVGLATLTEQVHNRPVSLARLHITHRQPDQLGSA